MPMSALAQPARRAFCQATLRLAHNALHLCNVGLSAYSTKPEATVYSGPTWSHPSRVTLRTLRRKHRDGERLTMVTAYDYPSAAHVDRAGIDILLVGDSAAMVVHGHDTTLPLTLEEMLTHCKAVARGARRPFLVADLPFGTFETGPHQAIASSVRLLKEGGVDAVKIEGGFPGRVEAVEAVVRSGVAVMGHVGLTPQSVSALGGFRPTGQSTASAVRVLQEARALQEAGCFALVLECVPAPLAAAVTASLDIPTIGIGAGPHCSGQVLVYHDMLGMLQHPHHAQVTPKFCKSFASIGLHVDAALQDYAREVREGSYPGPQYSPYKINRGQGEALVQKLKEIGLEDAAHALASTMSPEEAA